MVIMLNCVIEMDYFLVNLWYLILVIVFFNNKYLVWWLIGYFLKYKIIRLVYIYKFSFLYVIIDLR